MYIHTSQYGYSLISQDGEELCGPCHSIYKLAIEVDRLALPTTALDSKVELQRLQQLTPNIKECTRNLTLGMILLLYTKDTTIYYPYVEDHSPNWEVKEYIHGGIETLLNNRQEACTIDEQMLQQVCEFKGIESKHCVTKMRYLIYASRRHLIPLLTEAKAQGNTKVAEHCQMVLDYISGTNGK